MQRTGLRHAFTALVFVILASALGAGRGGATPDRLPEAATKAWNEGQDAIANRQWVECVENFSEVTKLAPQHLEAFVKLGYCQSELRQWSEAAKTYEHALTLSPSDSVRCDLLNALAFAQASAGQHDAALSSYEALLQKRPNDKDAMVGYAYILKSQDRPVEAVMAYQRALEIDPTDVSILRTVGELCQQNEMIEQSVAVYERWSVLEPDNVEPLRHLGFLLYKGESCDRGIEVYEQVIALDASNPGDLLNLGMLYQKCQLYGKALERLNTYRELRPDDAATVDCRIAFLYEDSGKWEEGLRVVEGWATKRPDDPCLQYAWARLLEKRGLAQVGAEQFTDAVASYRLAEAKLQPVLGDSQWGEAASAQLKRLDQLIRIAEGKRKQAESEE